jgi:hypothetical protein
MNDPRGSVWRKRDLHVHISVSFHWKEGTGFTKKTSEERDKILDQLIDKVVQSDVAVFGIMDYWTFDGYLAIRDRLAARKLTIPKAIFPGMELRIEAPVDFRLNIQVVLSDSLTKQQLQDFKAALRIGAIDRALTATWKKCWLLRRPWREYPNQKPGTFLRCSAPPGVLRGRNPAHGADDAVEPSPTLCSSLPFHSHT